MPLAFELEGILSKVVVEKLGHEGIPRASLQPMPILPMSLLVAVLPKLLLHCACSQLQCLSLLCSLLHRLPGVWCRCSSMGVWG